MGIGLIHRAVERQARLTPDAVAVVDGATRLSYGALDALADAWAEELSRTGVGPGTLVPVLLPRSAGLYVSLLAVLKCGAGYAALDPRWPGARIEGVLRQLAAPVLVTDAPRPPGAGPVWHPPALDAAAGAAPAGGRAAGRPGAFTAYDGPDSTPAAVFFTSGTSGAPKGVVSPHAATTRLFAPDGPLAFGPGTAMMQAAPAPWDAFSLELWGMLTTGGTCVTAPEDYLLPDTLRRLIDADRVDTAWLTASLFNLFTEIDVECFAGLRRLFIGGERLSTAHVARFLTRHPDIRLLNGYGPVESCVFATVHPITPGDCERPYGVPIGREVPGTEVHVLDPDGFACAPGTAGELCLAGTGLAHGYLGDPDLTAARFPEHPVEGRQLRYYRTGDRGFRDADGVLHFTGRTDRQVKIRGHRIEPEEIEAHASALPGIAGCAAVPVPGELGTYDRLALFYTADGEEPGPPEAVRRSLGRVLPPHAVPDVVQRMERLPVTANGKIDRSLLLAALAG
ncbi:amino acid adenylation domain-containing protein [Streptomyces sp. NBC_00083]|uniref:amino acid adenylation domain-containing protein n=1 Tax=Streptomyces sp. NBC_00083 TaxID=2975647 RepID=UPI00224CE4EF|nr:amino acid adenylation domain-containing protein [Streptomyces sp. NBC_00083]MCX5383340.1 amino acid adenylation domain-containing protein [Streptomyces sp. NBC_00083]